MLFMKKKSTHIKVFKVDRNHSSFSQKDPATFNSLRYIQLNFSVYYFKFLYMQVDIFVCIHVDIHAYEHILLQMW